jgi:hypothetical protein
MPCGCQKTGRYAQTAKQKAAPGGSGPKVWTGSRPAAKKTEPPEDEAKPESE